MMAHAITLKRPQQRLAELWRAYPRETAGMGLLAVIVAVAIGGAAHSTSELPAGSAAVAPPAPPPMVLRQVAPDQALQINQQIPIAGGPNPSAAPFVFKGNAAARIQALQCLASAVYYEAGDQGDEGERAVAQVVLNRVRHPAFPASVCDVVYQGSTRLTGCQFTFTCDGSLNRQPDMAGWRRAYGIAQEALAGSVYAPVGWATHYHANYVLPVWASELAKSAVVGAHLFYRWAGSWGRPAAFTESYSGHEPSATALRNAALAAVHTSPAASGNSAVAEIVAKVPGAEALPLAPSMRGDKRVAIRFNLAARKASDTAPHKDYVSEFGASDNLKWSLSSEVVAANEKPLGKPAPKAPGPETASAGR